MTNVTSITINEPPIQAQSFEKIDIRCYNCNKLLGKSAVKQFLQIEIKCPRCRVVNEV
jgi:hypothetical protein